MLFNNRSEFISASSSEKIVLAQIQATSRLFTWSVYSGSVYSRVTDYFVYRLKQDQTPLTQVSSIGAVVAGTFYYDIETSTVYVRTIGSVNPATIEMIATYRFFYSTVTLNNAWDLQIGSKQVLYEGRISSSPGYKSKVGIEQSLTSLIGTGDLVLENTDGGLDTIFDTLFFENQECFVYNWNRQLAISEAQIIYRGRVTNKTYDGETIKFTVKDQIFDLEQEVPQDVYTSDDNVNINIQGRVKRWVYGKVDGLLAQSVDQVGEGYDITGTVTGSSESTTITGTGTLFLSELSPDDTLTISGQEFTIQSISSNTSLDIDNEPEFSFTDESALVKPSISPNTKNRTFLIAGHAGARLTKQVVSVIQLNRVELNNTEGLVAGDIVEFDTLERIEIKNVAPGNIIVLRQNLILMPSISSDVTRQPIQNIYVNSKEVNSEDYTISNTSTELSITLDNDTEFNLARAKDLGVTLTFTNGTRNVTTAESVDLREVIKSRDWIRPSDITFTTYYEVLSVDETSLKLRVNFTDPTHTGDTQIKSPDYITDETPVSVNVLGRTENNLPDGTWINTASQAVKDLITQLGITNINNASFDETKVSSSQLISLALPVNSTDKLIKTKEAVDLINKSVYGSLTLDRDLNLKYAILQNNVPSDITVIKDSDVVSWKIKATNGQTFRNTVIRYRHKDYDRITETSGSLAASHSNDFIRDYIGTDKTKDFDVYLYNTEDAQIMSHRFSYFNRLGRSDITIETDLRLETLNIGDIVQLELSRLYKRFGDSTSRKKLMIVVGLTKTGESMTIEATDLNNTFNSSSVITPNDASDYSLASTDEKLHYGYITTSQGIVNNDEQTSNINLIS